MTTSPTNISIVKFYQRFACMTNSCALTVDKKIALTRMIFSMLISPDCTFIYRLCVKPLMANPVLVCNIILSWFISDKLASLFVWMAILTWSISPTEISIMKAKEALVVRWGTRRPSSRQHFVCKHEVNSLCICIPLSCAGWHERWWSAPLLWKLSRWGGS